LSVASSASITMSVITPATTSMAMLPMKSPVPSWLTSLVAVRALDELDDGGVRAAPHGAARDLHLVAVEVLAAEVELGLLV